MTFWEEEEEEEEEWLNFTKRRIMVKYSNVVGMMGTDWRWGYPNWKGNMTKVWVSFDFLCTQIRDLPERGKLLCVRASSIFSCFHLHLLLFSEMDGSDFSWCAHFIHSFIHCPGCLVSLKKTLSSVFIKVSLSSSSSSSSFFSSPLIWWLGCLSSSSLSFFPIIII